MSRRIQTGAGPGMAAVAGTPPDDYLGRLAKYIPAEIVGLYIGMVAAAPAGHPKIGTILWVIFGLNFVLVPIYMFIVTSRETGKGPLWPQIVLATIAFPVWAFAMGGPFKQFDWYQGWIATMLLMFITVVFGLMKPKPGS